jgi:hypothetical protein
MRNSLGCNGSLPSHFEHHQSKCINLDTRSGDLVRVVLILNQMVGAMRFFYLTVLNRPWRGHEFAVPQKKTIHLPVILESGRSRMSGRGGRYPVLAHHHHGRCTPPACGACGGPNWPR